MYKTKIKNVLLRMIPRPVPLNPEQALRDITSDDGKNVYASGDWVFKGAVFGRDSLEIAEDLLVARPRLVRNILISIAGLQGQTFNRKSEEEPGKIHHEYRQKIVDGQPLNELQAAIFNELTALWGETDSSSLLYYGSIDSTPLFIRTLGRYCELYGKHILTADIQRLDGSSNSLGKSLEEAVAWLVDRLQNSPNHLLQFKAISPKGILNQTWKDSDEFYVHASGRLANHKKPIVSVELQGLSYDALIVAAKLLPERSSELLVLAKKVQLSTLHKLWLPREHYFALGQDRDSSDQPRTIKTKTANPAELLNSGIFDNLSGTQKRYYLSSIVKMIMSGDFLTDAGIRGRALSQASLVPFWDYHGSYSVWPKETYDISKGLRRQGFGRLADQLENRLINIVRRTGSYPEFIYVDKEGRVMLSEVTAQSDDDATEINSTNLPCLRQSWTISAIVAIADRRRHRLNWQKQDWWQKRLEDQILKTTKNIRYTADEKRLNSYFPGHSYRVSVSRDTKVKLIAA